MTISARSKAVLTNWPLVSLVVSLLMLAAAHAFERFGNMPPCALCLHQREAYWAAASVSALAIIATRFRPDTMASRAFALMLACAFGAGALIAGFHVGVEMKWWLGLASCTSGGTYEASSDLLGALSTSMEVPACDKVPWSLLGISMAGWNMLVSLGLTGASVMAAIYPNGFSNRVEGETR